MPVIVNNIEITDEQVFAEMQHHPAKNREEAIHMAAQALTIRELLIQDAIAKGFASKGDEIDSEPEAYDERIEKLLQEVIKTPEADKTACKRFYDNNQQKFNIDSKILPFENVREMIAEYLGDVSWQTAVTQYIKILAGKAKIAGVQLDFTDSPLVQ